MTLKAILKNKTVTVISVSLETSIAKVIDLLAEKRIGAVLVTDHTGRMCGILSERDIVRRMAKDAAQTFDLTAEQLMTPSPQTASLATTVPQAMEMMTNGRFRHLPVVENGKLIGLVSIGDVVKERINQQAHEVDSLRAYVAGAA